MISLEKAVIARLNKNGKHFEILVDPELVQQYKAGRADISEILAVDAIFTESRKGTKATPQVLESNFATKEINEVAKMIMKDGTIQTTEDQRVKERQEKWDKIVALIAMNAVDPQTHKPIPAAIINDAMKQAMFKVDERKIEDQLQLAIKAIRPKIPFKFEEKTVQIINLPTGIAGKCRELCKKLATVKEEKWGADNSLTITVSIPAGLLEDFTEKINQLTHGKTEMKFI